MINMPSIIQPPSSILFHKPDTVRDKSYDKQDYQHDENYLQHRRQLVYDRLLILIVVYYPAVASAAASAASAAVAVGSGDERPVVSGAQRVARSVCGVGAHGYRVVGTCRQGRVGNLS